MEMKCWVTLMENSLFPGLYLLFCVTWLWTRSLYCVSWDNIKVNFKHTFGVNYDSPHFEKRTFLTDFA